MFQLRVRASRRFLKAAHIEGSEAAGVRCARVVPRLHAPRSFTFERTVSVSRFQKWCSANKMIFMTRATKDMLKTKTDNAILDQDSS